MFDGGIAQRRSELAGEFVIILHRHPPGRRQRNARERNLPIILADFNGVGYNGRLRRAGVDTSRQQRGEDGRREKRSRDAWTRQLRNRRDSAKNSDSLHKRNVLTPIRAAGLSRALLFYKVAPCETNAKGRRKISLSRFLVSAKNGSSS